MMQHMLLERFLASASTYIDLKLAFSGKHTMHKITVIGCLSQSVPPPQIAEFLVSSMQKQRAAKLGEWFWGQDLQKHSKNFILKCHFSESFHFLQDTASGPDRWDRLSVHHFNWSSKPFPMWPMAIAPGQESISWIMPSRRPKTWETSQGDRSKGYAKAWA